MNRDVNLPATNQIDSQLLTHLLDNKQAREQRCCRLDTQTVCSRNRGRLKNVRM